MHENCINKYAPKIEMRSKIVEDCKRNLQSLQAIFYKSKPINRAKAAIIASCKITEILAKKRNPF
jgi:hypothetical protein